MREERSIAEYKVWQNAWKENINEPLIIALLDRWEVEYHNMEGDFWPPLSNEQIRDRIRNPLGSKTVRQFAEEGTEAIIVVDDLSRGTPVRPIAEFVLEELLAGGISKEHIRFICALGNHAALTRADFVRKSGEEIVEQYPVFNHNPYEHCVKISVNSHGEDVELNREL